MEKRVAISDGVQIEIKQRKIVVKGSRGSVERDFGDPRFNTAVIFEKSGNEFIVRTESERRKIKAFVGTVAAHVRNMSDGVMNGYVYRLKIYYTHFPITIEIKGSGVIVKNFLGEKNLRHAEIVGKTKVEIKKDEIFVSGTNKEEVGQTAANIEMSCRLSGKDRRIFLDGIYIVDHGLDK